MAYYKKHGIQRVGGGVITMRHRSGSANWFRAVEGLETLYGPAGEYILKVFAAQDFLEEVQDDAALLGMSFTVSPDLRVLEQKEPSRDGWIIEETEIHLSRGIYQKGRIDPYVERLLIQCDGSKPLRDLIGDMASALGIEVSRIESPACSMVRDFIGRGFLLPPQQAGAST